MSSLLQSSRLSTLARDTDAIDLSRSQQYQQQTVETGILYVSSSKGIVERRCLKAHHNLTLNQVTDPMAITAARACADACKMQVLARPQRKRERER